MRRLFILIVAITLTGLAATSAMAMHKGAGNLVCGACHTMHNSQGSTSTGDGDGGMGGTTGGSLILHSGPATCGQFCLNCHAQDGVNGGTTYTPPGTIPPKVLTTNSWTAADGFSKIGAGGNFYWELGTSPWNSGTNVPSSHTLTRAEQALGYGHVMTTNNVVPPGGEVSITGGFSCCSCHDPHGTNTFNNSSINYFRNLRTTPSGSGSTSVDLNNDAGLSGNQAWSWKGSMANSYALVTDGTTAQIWPISDGSPTGTADSNQYSDSDGSSGISKWCATCHDNWHEANVSGNKASNTWDWNRHPVGYIITSNDTGCGGASTIDWNHYTAGDGSSITTDTRLPAAQGGGYAAGNPYYADTNNQDRVFCLSCHFAHGGPYLDSLRWQYTTDVSRTGQSSTALASNIGCQQCHNK